MYHLLMTLRGAKDSEMFNKLSGVIGPTAILVYAIVVWCAFVMLMEW